jgi:phosphoheptose isomerase
MTKISTGYRCAGGALSQIADFPIDIPARNTQPVQEATLPLYHMLVDLTERALFDRENTRS